MNQAVLNILSDKKTTSLQEKDTTISAQRTVNSLVEAEVNKEYIIKEVISEDAEMVNFLFTLGCFKGQPVTLISILSETFVIAIKDARYSIDADLAQVVKLV
ncbi:MAG: FeoA family protein [Psychromonas sp.]